MKNSSSDHWIAYLVALTTAALVLLLGLQSFGIWQPAEIHVADMARHVIHPEPGPGSRGGHVVFDRAPAQVYAVILGFRYISETELGGRLPGALLALLALGALMAAARSLGDRRLAAYVGIAYATLPLVFMNARQMFGGSIAQSATTLSLAGFALALWGRDPRWKLGGALSAVLGLWLGVKGAGVLLGVVPILGALGISVLLRFDREDDIRRAVGIVALGAGVLLAGLAMKKASVELTGYSPWVGAGGGTSAPATWQTFEGYVEQVAHGTFPWTGLVPFGLLRLISPPSREQEGPRDGALDASELSALDPWRESGLRLMAFLFVTLTFAAQTFHMQLFGMSPFVAVAPLALGLAVLLRDCERELTPWRTVAVGAALLTVLMLRDYLQFPRSSFAALGLPEGGPAFPTGFQAKVSEWLRLALHSRGPQSDVPPAPAEIYFLVETVMFLVLGILVVFQGSGEVKLIPLRRPMEWLAETERHHREVLQGVPGRSPRMNFGALVLSRLRVLLAALGSILVIVGSTGAAMNKTLTTPALGVFRAILVAPFAIVFGLYASLAIWNAYAWLGQPGGAINRYMGSRVAWVAVAATLVALTITQGYIPALSEHMSPRGVWAVVRALRHGTELVGRYGGPTDDPATRYYTRVQPETVSTEEAAVSWLTSTDRRFLVVGSDVFAGLNRSYRRARHVNVPVADSSNSTLFVAVSDLEGRSNRNPLERFISTARPDRREMVHPAREAGRFEDSFEYIGYSVDSNNMTYVPLGGSFKITFFFHVLRDSTRNWQIFVHTDGQGPRINGDHEPVGGKYPVRYWQAGDYIRDQVRIDIPITYRPGAYTVFMGFFDGGDRMRLTGGDSDRDNRVAAARITVR